MGLITDPVMDAGQCRIAVMLAAAGSLDLLAAQTSGVAYKAADRVATPTLIPRRSAITLAR
ncbi:hypothetical protein [Actinomyces qiguomingii]|uniref:hypothetical protein n=1 Tax=Actinomyces qiguomingii TaxID=2057800 RepID=UPI000C9FFFBB|nr:hypothetical protein [Actinomyces qiguomingii]